MLRRLQVAKIEARTENLQEDLEKNFFTNLVKINFNYIDKYYLQTQTQADKSFLLCAVAASVSFRLLYVMILLAHDRRKIVRTAVTEHPTAAWLSRQVTEAFPWDTAPRYLLRDRDGSYGAYFCNRVQAMGITEVIRRRAHPGKTLTSSA